MTSKKGCLAGKVAIITGGGTGLGKATALALAGEGADVVISSRRLEAIEPTARELSDLGVRSLAVPTDITDSRQVNRMVEQTLDKMGRIDILMNYAGIVRNEKTKPIWEITDEEWRLGIDTNLSGAFYCCRAVGKYLVAQKSGKVVNVASGFGLRGGRDNYMYCTAKGGILQLTRSLALTWAKDNIQVNTIAPGFVDTTAWQPGSSVGVAEDSGLGSQGKFIPVGRFGQPPDVGSLGLFLASDASDYITGALFIADGGGMVGYAPTGFSPVMISEEV